MLPKHQSTNKIRGNDARSFVVLYCVWTPKSREDLLRTTPIRHPMVLLEANWLPQFVVWGMGPKPQKAAFSCTLMLWENLSAPIGPKWAPDNIWTTILFGWIPEIVRAELCVISSLRSILFHASIHRSGLRTVCIFVWVFVGFVLGLCWAPTFPLSFNSLSITR